MKKLLMIVFAAFTAATIANAQTNSLANANKTTTLKLISKFENMDAASSRPIEVSDRIIKKFEKQFSDATDAAWMKTSNGFVVRFTAKGIQNWAYLSRHGNCQGCVRYYTEKELPADVRQQVRSSYYDYTITFVKEVNYNHSTAYLITIEDETTWKVIHVVNGETEVSEEHLKG